MPPFFSCISQLRCNFNRDKQKELDFEKSNSFCSNSHSCSKSVPLLLCRTPLSCEYLFYFLVYGSFSLPSSISRVFLFSFLFLPFSAFFAQNLRIPVKTAKRRRRLTPSVIHHVLVTAAIRYPTRQTHAVTAHTASASIRGSDGCSAHPHLT